MTSRNNSQTAPEAMIELAADQGAVVNDEENAIPRMKMKLFSAAFSFFVAGTNDGSMGALLPYILREYKIGTSLVAVL
jgi:hypothetical protein